jgi:hypothetical protein
MMENDPKKGPGISLIDENQRRRTNIRTREVTTTFATNFRYGAKVCASEDMMALA